MSFHLFLPSCAISGHHRSMLLSAFSSHGLRGQFFYVNFNMHIHCSLPSWTILVREACGHHRGLRSFFSQMKFVVVGCGFCRSLICNGVNCHLVSSVFFESSYCSAPLHVIFMPLYFLVPSCVIFRRCSIQVLTYIQLIWILQTILMLIWSMHVHCSFFSSTILVWDAWGHHGCSFLAVKCRNCGFWGFVALWSAMVEIATHCPLFSSLIGMCIWTMWGRCIMWFWVVFACLQLGKFENVSWMPPLATWRTTHSSPRKLGPRAEAVTEEEVSTSGGNEKFDRVEVWEPPRIERLYEDDLIIAISKPGTLLVSHLTDSWCLYWLLSEFICFLWAIKVIP